MTRKVAVFGVREADRASGLFMRVGYGGRSIQAAANPARGRLRMLRHGYSSSTIRIDKSMALTFLVNAPTEM